MQFATVIGLVTATTRIDPLRGIRFCVLQDTSNRLIIAADPEVSPMIGDQVYFEEGGNAAMAWPSGVKPVDAVIVGIVDDEDG